MPGPASFDVDAAQQVDRVMPPDRWREAAAEHEARADRLSAGRRARAVTGVAEPVDDFLFRYYSLTPRRLRRWHPGIGRGLRDADAHLHYRWYATADGVTALDPVAMLADRGTGVAHLDRLLRAVAAAPARLDCFGLHEWAMVYRSERTRHDVPLRLGAAGTDEVLRSLPLRCGHFDAFRFFTEPAKPLNRDRLDRDSQLAHDQPGCVHVTMDLYKAAYKLGPAVPGELLLDCFELARRARVVDMRAGPYDLPAGPGGPGDPIRIETAEGRAQYAAAQRELAAAAAPLRERLLTVIDSLRARPC